VHRRPAQLNRPLTASSPVSSLACVMLSAPTFFAKISRSCLPAPACS